MKSTFKDEIAALYKYTEAPMQIHVFDSDEVGDMSWTSWYQASSAAAFPADRLETTDSYLDCEEI